MGKKFLEVRVQGRRRVLNAADLKSIFYYHKKKTPRLPRCVEEEAIDESHCSSPTET